LSAQTPVLLLILPADFSLEIRRQMTASRTWTVPVTALKGQVYLKAGNSTAAAVFQAVLVKNTEILAKADLSLYAHEQFLVDQTGSTIQAEGGRIKVQFPNGVLPEKALVNIGRPSGDAVPPYSLSGHPFEIKAQGQQSEQELKQFSQEITISVSYADLGVHRRWRRISICTGITHKRGSGNRCRRT
jgi:hypothetical protein